MSWALRATRRCWQSGLGEQLDEDGRVPPLEMRSAAHLVLRDFLNQRKQQPDGTEGPIVVLGPGYMKLKCGRYRAATLHEDKPQGREGIRDPEQNWNGVVWLLAVGYRKDGDPDDAYEDFARMGAAALSPDSTDYAHLYADIRQAALDSVRADLQEKLAELLDAARDEPDVLHRLEVEPFAGIAIRVFSDHGHRILVLSAIDSQRRPVSEAVTEVIITTVFPGVPLDQLEWPDPRLVAEISGYTLEPGEFALSCRYKRP